MMSMMCDDDGAGTDTADAFIDGGDWVGEWMGGGGEVDGELSLRGGGGDLSLRGGGGEWMGGGGDNCSGGFVYVAGAGGGAGASGRGGGGGGGPTPPSPSQGAPHR